MKFIKLLPVLVIFMVSACHLDPPHTRYDNVVIPIEDRMVPEIAPANIPLTIYASASQYNSCWSNIRFFFEEESEYEYYLYALADFETYGNCADMIVSADTVITMTPETPGDYIITVWMSNSAYDRDTITVGEILPLE